MLCYVKPISLLRTSFTRLRLNQQAYPPDRPSGQMIETIDLIYTRLLRLWAYLVFIHWYAEKLREIELYKIMNEIQNPPFERGLLILCHPDGSWELSYPCTCIVLVMVESSSWLYDAWALTGLRCHTDLHIMYDSTINYWPKIKAFKYHRWDMTKSLHHIT